MPLLLRRHPGSARSPPHGRRPSTLPVAAVAVPRRRRAFAYFRCLSSSPRPTSVSGLRERWWRAVCANRGRSWAHTVRRRRSSTRRWWSRNCRGCRATECESVASCSSYQAGSVRRRRPRRSTWALALCRRAASYGVWRIGWDASRQWTFMHKRHTHDIMWHLNVSHCRRHVFCS